MAKRTSAFYRPSFVTLMALTLALVSSGWVRSHAAESPSEALKSTAPLPPEFFIFQVADLPQFGSKYHSWNLIRGSLIWTPAGTIDLNKIVWPKWDKSRVPPALTYTGGLQAFIEILDEQNVSIARVDLKKGFTPLLFTPPSGVEPKHFKIELSNKPTRYKLTTKSYAWPKLQELFKCTVEVITKDETQVTMESQSSSLMGEDNTPKEKKSYSLESHPKVKLCLESLEGVARTAPPDKQWFVEIEWPKIESRRAMMFVSETERVYRNLLSKNRHVLVTKRSSGRNFFARAGLTRVETLEEPKITIDPQYKSEWHGEVPRSETGILLTTQIDSTDGGNIQIYGFASDAIKDRAITSPAEFEPRIHLQFINQKAQDQPIKKTEFEESRTGVAGIFRPWYLAASANFHTLKSSRGEELSSLNLPAIEVAWNSGVHGIEPFLSLEPGLIHYDSTLALQEGQGGVRWRWMPTIAPYLGYFNYALRGQNPGASRLGSIDGISAGLYAFHREQDYFFRGRAGAISSSPLSFDTYAEIAKVLPGTLNDRGFFVGVFGGFSQYRQELTNRTRQVETFSETRFKLGITVGLAGPDFVESNRDSSNRDENSQSEFRHEEAKWNIQANALFLIDNTYHIFVSRKLSERAVGGVAFSYATSKEQDGRTTTSATKYAGGLFTNWFFQHAYQNSWFAGGLLEQVSSEISSVRGSATALSTASPTIASGKFGYQWYFSGLNASVGLIYKHATLQSVQLNYSSGSPAEYSLRSTGLAADALVGWAF